jgi:hypothetical protein
MGWLAGVLNAIKLVNTIIAGAKDIISFINQSRNEAWFQHWSDAMVLLRSAKTSEDRLNAARKIRDALGGL